MDEERSLLGQVGHILLTQFKLAARARVDAANPLDRGEAPADAGYDRAMQGLRMLAKQNARISLSALLSWRKDVIEAVKVDQTTAANITLRKRLAVEATFLEAALQVVEPAAEMLPDNQTRAVEKLAFDWILNTERYVGPQYPELHKARDKVVELCASLIGALSEVRLGKVADHFFSEVDQKLSSEKNSDRQELMQLCMGLRLVRLPCTSSAQVEAAKDFLIRANPVNKKNVAPVRKSSFQHALCDMLYSILGANVTSDMPRVKARDMDADVMSRWYHAVTSIRSEIMSWTARQSKHAVPGWPLATLLTCLQDDASFLANNEQLVEALLMRLKDKTLRTMVLGCLCQCMNSYLLRFAALPHRERLYAWLSRTSKPVLQSLRKGHFLMPDQQDMVRMICVTVAQQSPEFGLGSLVLDLLAFDFASGWDGVMIGLRALLVILLAAPFRGQLGQLSRPESDGEGGTMSRELLAMLRKGQQPLDAYEVPQLKPRISAALSRILNSCHQNYAAITITRPGPEGVQRERPTGLVVFATALRCVPYVWPDVWAQNTAKLAEDLSYYTINLDSTVCSMAVEVQHRVLRGIPHLRNTMLQGMTASLSRIPEDYPKVVADALGQLISLMGDWVAILDEMARGGMAGMEPSGQSLRFDLPRVESAVLACLCSSHPEVRVKALDALGAARVLDKGLAACRALEAGEWPASDPPNRVVYVMDVIEEMGHQCAVRSYWDLGSWAVQNRQWRPVPAASHDIFQDLLRKAASGDDLARWAQCLARIVKHAAPLCPAALRAAYPEVCARLMPLLPKEVGGRAPSLGDWPLEGYRADSMRAYTAVACALPPSSGRLGTSPSQRELMRALISLIRLGPDVLAQAMVAALGGCNTQLVDTLLEETQTLIDEYSGVLKSTRGRTRREDVRLACGQIYALMAVDLPPGVVRANKPMRVRLLDWVLEAQNQCLTRDSLSGVLLSPDSVAESMQLRYCLAWVVRPLCLDLGTSGSALQRDFGPQHRASLFTALLLAISEGQLRADKEKGIREARTRLKDPEAAKQAEADILSSSDYFVLAAQTAMASLLLGPAFNADARQAKGRIFQWVDQLLAPKIPLEVRLLENRGLVHMMQPPRATARAALLGLLSTNRDLAEVFLDQCYSPQAIVSRVYFQVLAEVHATQALEVQRHVLLSLVLHKIVDAEQEVRDDALHMLGVLARTWKEGAVKGAAPGAAAEGVVIGNLQDSCQQFQYQLSAKLARDHPEVSDKLCVEMMTRQLANAGATGLQHQVLSCLTPWMQNLSFDPRWKDNWSEQLLKSLYYVTLELGQAFATEVERLWTTVASNKRNIIPILDFLITRGLEEIHSGETEPINKYFIVAKRISLFLARKLPQMTIDHLVYEISHMMADEDALPARPAPLTQALQFHHTRSASLAKRASSRHLGRPSSHHNRQAGSQHGSFAAHISSGAHHLGHGLSMPLSLLMPQQIAQLPAQLLPDFVDSTLGLGSMLTGNFKKMGELLKSGSGKSDAFASSPSMAGRLSYTADELVRRGSDMSAHAAPARTLTRAEVGLCLLAEVAWEQDEDLRSHLPLLLHASIVCLDSPEPLVAAHALLAITHLLYSLSVRHLELARAGGAMVPEYERVKALIKYLQAMRGRPLWKHEDASLQETRIASADALRALVVAILDSIFFESDLRERWAGRALTWALEAEAPHLACRSHQVFRALRPAPNSEACAALLACLHKCTSLPTAPTSLRMAVDIVLSLQVVVECMDAGQLVLFPQLFVACIALLPLNLVQLSVLVMELLSKVLDQLDLTDFTVQSVLLSGLAQASVGTGVWALGRGILENHSLLAVQQLVIKGLFRPETELVAVEVMAQLAHQIAQASSPAPGGMWGVYCPGSGGLGDTLGGLTPVLGPPKAQLALSLFALLPWLCANFRYSPQANTAALCLLAHKEACLAAGFADLADALSVLSPGNSQDLGQLLGVLSPPLCAAFFPGYAKLGLERILDTLSRGDEDLQGPCLAILQAVLTVPKLKLGALPGSTLRSGFWDPLAAHLQGPLSRQALQVMGALSAADMGASPIDALEPQASWPSCLTEDSGISASCSALGKVISGWGGAHGRSFKNTRTPVLLPFLDRETAALQDSLS